MSENVIYTVGKSFSVVTLVKWVAGSRRDPAKIPGTHRDPAGISPRWPIFPAGSFPGKIPAAYLGKNLSEKSVLAEIPPRKKTLLRDPGENPAWNKISVVFPVRT